MAQSHGPLSRTNTAPVFSTRSAGNGPALSQTMSHNLRSSQLSGSTAYTTSSSTTSLSSLSSSATLLPPPLQQMAQNGGPVVATNNIINQRADASRSLYQICVLLRQRLSQVPDFDAHLNDSDDEDDGQDMDPVSSLWRCLRKGTPLLTIYNSLHPQELLQVDDQTRPERIPKLAAFKFVEACLKGDLKIPPGECFSLQDLFGDDTTGFVKVCWIYDFTHSLLFVVRGVPAIHCYSLSLRYPTSIHNAISRKTTSDFILGDSSHQHCSRCRGTTRLPHDI
jgi:cell division control protein 24